MIFISHRGNIDGKIEVLENNPGYLRVAMSHGYHIEADVWYHNREFYLGHDSPQHKTDKYFLSDSRVWCHAKNTLTLMQLLCMGVHCFFHNTDDCTLTSRGFVWTYPGRALSEVSICVLPESIETQGIEDIKISAGVWSDYIKKYKEKL